MKTYILKETYPNEEVREYLEFIAYLTENFNIISIKIFDDEDYVDVDDEEREIPIEITLEGTQEDIDELIKDRG